MSQESKQNRPLSERFSPVDLNGIVKKPKPLSYMLHGLLKGSTGMICAPGGTGKSMLKLQLGMALASGLHIDESIANLLPESFKPQQVVMFLGEDTHDIMHNRLYDIYGLYRDALSEKELHECRQNWQANLKIYPLQGEIHHLLKQNKDDGLTTSQFYDDLLQFATDADLIMLDPLRRFHGLDENDNSKMMFFIQKLEQIAKSQNCTFLLSHHTNKASISSGGSDQGASRGASALTDGIRWQLNLSTMTRQEARLYFNNEEAAQKRKQFVKAAHSKCNYGALLPDFWLCKSSKGVLESVTMEVIQFVDQVLMSRRTA